MIFRLCCLMLVLGLSLVNAAAVASEQSSVTDRIAATLDQLEKDGDFAAARNALSALFDQVAIHSPLSQPDDFRQAALAVRLVQQLALAEGEIRMDLLKLLRANPRLAQAVCFSIKPEHQRPQRVHAMLHRFAQVRGDLLEPYANLVTAICLVHDRPFVRAINENTTSAPDPLFIFDYFVQNESRTSFGIRNMPTELLIYVVDVTADIDELSWSLNRYSRDRDIGKRFFEIKYDEGHFVRGRPKRVTEEGFTMQNILRYGGVCADQAYFAMTVGKALGVPTTYTFGRASDVSHAWVGFLQSNGRTASWNFDAGRYEAYQGVRGIVMDPQTRQLIPDSHVSLLAGLAMADEASRYQAAGMVDAAKRLKDVERRRNFAPPPLVESEDRSRTADLASQLSIVEAALRIAPEYAPGWFFVSDRAEDLSLQQKRHWANALHRLCGNKYLDFQLAVLVPMVQNVKNVQDQNALWNAAFDRFSSRHDLAAEIRMLQGKMWEADGNLNRAGMCYEDIITRYANAGHFVVDALAEAERLLRENGRADMVPTLYANAWSQIRKPQRMAEPFAQQSNWWRVGNRYAQLLQQAGRQRDAQNVVRQLQAN